MRAKFPKFFPLSLGMRQKLLFLMEQLECMVFCPVRQYSKRQKCWKNSVNCGLWKILWIGDRILSLKTTAFYLPSLMVYAHNLHNMYVLCTVRQYDQKAQMLEKPNDSRPSNTAKAAFYVPSPSIYAHSVCIYHVCIYIQYMHASMPSARNMPRLEAQKSVGLIFFSPQPRKLSETCSHGI